MSFTLGNLLGWPAKWCPLPSLALLHLTIQAHGLYGDRAWSLWRWGMDLLETMYHGLYGLFCRLFNSYFSEVNHELSNLSSLLMVGWNSLFALLGFWEQD